MSFIELQKWLDELTMFQRKIKYSCGQKFSSFFLIKPQNTAKKSYIKDGWGNIRPHLKISHLPLPKNIVTAPDRYIVDRKK